MKAPIGVRIRDTGKENGNDYHGLYEHYEEYFGVIFGELKIRWKLLFRVS